MNQNPATPKRIIFLHHPKTGGTTLHDLLTDQIDRSKVSPYRDNNNILNAPEDNLSDYTLFSGHYARNGVSKVDTGDSVKITILRHPSDRLLSLYNYWRSYSDAHISKHNLWYVKIAKEVSFEEFVDPDSRIGEINRNAYCRALVPPHMQNSVNKMGSDEAFDAALEYINKFDYVFVTSLLSIQIQNFFPILGFSVPRKIGFKREISNHYTEEPYLEKVDLYKYDDNTRKKTAEINHADYMLYDHFYCKSLLENREAISSEILKANKELHILRKKFSQGEEQPAD